jgi:hypothetical protein
MRRSSPDLNFKPRQNVGKLPKPIPPYISLEWARVENKTRIPSVLNSAAPVSPQRCCGLGKCSAVTSPSDSSSTQPGLGASPKHSLRPSVCMGMGRLFSMALFYSRSMPAPRPGMINAGYMDTTRAWPSSSLRLHETCIISVPVTNEPEGLNWIRS